MFKPNVFGCLPFFAFDSKSFATFVFLAVTAAHTPGDLYVGQLTNNYQLFREMFFPFASSVNVLLIVMLTGKIKLADF